MTEKKVERIVIKNINKHGLQFDTTGVIYGWHIDTTRFMTTPYYPNPPYRFKT